MANLKLSTNPSGTEGYLKLGESTGLTMKADGKVVGLTSSSETEAGMLPIATISDAVAFLNDNKALSPKKLADAFKGSNVSLAANGYQKLPSGLIIQWGTALFGHSSAGNLSATVAYPIAFNSAVLWSCTNPSTNVPQNYFSSSAYPGLTGITLHSYAATAGSPPVRWIAIGY